ncbi:MAG: hypothetical protein EBT47_05745 [Chloroflexi bacterium]|nr:hypothetical protein [Chloroflexota bacterium]
MGYPYNYAFLYGGSGICMALAAYLSLLYRIPVPRIDVKRESFQTAVIGGFKTVLRNRLLLIACVAYLLVYFGNMVQNNMSIFTREAVGRAPEDLAGYQLTLRFSFKMLCGFWLGWLLARTNPKLPLLITAGLQIIQNKGSGHGMDRHSSGTDFMGQVVINLERGSHIQRGLSLQGSPDGFASYPDEASRIMAVTRGVVAAQGQDSVAPD